MHNTRRQIFIKYWLPVIIYGVFIFFVSCVPGKDVPSLFLYQDIVFHFLEYAVFALLINRAIKGCCARLARFKRLSWVLALAFTYALFDEFHQSFVPGRTASVFDIAIDAIGSLIGGLLRR